MKRKAYDKKVKKRKIKALKVKGLDAAPQIVPQPTQMRISHEAIARSRHVNVDALMDRSHAFKPAQPPEFVVPKGKAKIAMDSNLAGFTGWAGNGEYAWTYRNGYSFLGYQALAEMAQIPEFRVISEVIATDATRKWISIQSASDQKDKAQGGEGNGKEDKIKQLEDELDRLDARASFRLIAQQDGFFGRAHLYIDTGDGQDPKELTTSIGDADKDSKVTLSKIKIGSIKAIRPVEAVWCYPANYNSSDPLSSDWYNPVMWFCMGKEIHRTRLLTFVGREVPDLLKPAFSFGGLSLTQMAKPYVDNWLQTRQSVSDLIHSFSIMVLSTNMQAGIQMGGEELFKRADLFNNLRDNKNLMMLDKESEEFQNVAAPLGSLDKLQAQAQEHMCAVSRIPLVKLLGLSPTGLNASSEGEIAVYDDTIHAYQEKFFTPHLTTIFKLAQINIWGRVDDDLSFDYEPLREMNELELADIREKDAKVHNEYVDRGILDPLEVRRVLSSEEDSPYANLDVDVMPETGILPKNIRASGTLDEDGELTDPPEPKPAAPPGGKKPASGKKA